MLSTSNGNAPNELLVDFIITLDGYAEGVGWQGWWGLEGPEYLRWLEEQPENDYTVLMGANTYREMAEMSAHATEEDAGFSEEEGESLASTATMSKVVFSSTLEEPLPMPNTTLLRGEATELVAEMKRNGQGPMRTMGSLTLVRSLMAAGLVDRYRLVIFPVITGHTGRKRIWDDYGDFSLELVESRTFDGRLQLLEYVPTVISGPLQRQPAGSG